VWESVGSNDNDNFANDIEIWMKQRITPSACVLGRIPESTGADSASRCDAPAECGEAPRSPGTVHAPRPARSPFRASSSGGTVWQLNFACTWVTFRPFGFDLARLLGHLMPN